MAHPFNDPMLRDWLVKKNSLHWNDVVIATDGEGPFDAGDFERFLESCPFRPVRLSAGAPVETSILIVGTDMWSEQRLQNFIEARTGQELKIYSQEMFVCFMLTGDDPFDESEAVLRRFAANHPTLQYLMTLGFAWPNTFVSGGGNEELSGEWPQKGLLRFMGYKVGKGGGQTAVRRRILEEVFVSARLPNVNSPAYMAEWGAPQSSKRLMKMANSLSSFCRNAKRREDPPLRAIEDWEEDLDWLHQRFYSGRFSFQWPSTYVE